MLHLIVYCNVIIIIFLCINPNLIALSVCILSDIYNTVRNFNMTKLCEYFTPEHANSLIQVVLTHNFITEPLLSLKTFNIEDHPDLHFPITFSTDRHILFLRKDSIAVIASLLVQYRYAIVHNYVINNNISPYDIDNTTLVKWKNETLSKIEKLSKRLEESNNELEQRSISAQLRALKHVQDLDVDLLNSYIDSFSSKACECFPTLDSISPQPLSPDHLSCMSFLVGTPGIGKVCIFVFLFNCSNMITLIYSFFVRFSILFLVVSLAERLLYHRYCYQRSCDCTFG